MENAGAHAQDGLFSLLFVKQRQVEGNHIRLRLMERTGFRVTTFIRERKTNEIQ